MVEGLTQAYVSPGVLVFEISGENFRLTAFKKSNFNFNTVKFENGKYTTDKLTPTSNTWFGSLSNYYMQGQFGKITYLTYDYKTKNNGCQQGYKSVCCDK